MEDKFQLIYFSPRKDGMKLAEGMRCDHDSLTILYRDDEVATAVLESAKNHDTVALIESGTLTLPDIESAREYTRLLSIAEDFGDTPLGNEMVKNPETHKFVKGLEARIKALEAGGPA